MGEVLEEPARVFSALGHPARLAMVLYLSRSRKGVVWEALRNALLEYGMDGDESYVNFHLGQLVSAGVVLKIKAKKDLYVYKLNSKIYKWVKLGALREEFGKSPRAEGTAGSVREGAAGGEVRSERGGAGPPGGEVEGAGPGGEQAGVHRDKQRGEAPKAHAEVPN
ncbi:MAG: hypothetical protein GXO07_00690 [Crenarchaeota archaeon]|nr:hypothetical protein [Thermoproteota archaeon]